MTTKDQAIGQALSEHMPEGTTHISIRSSYQISGPTIELRTYAFKYEEGVLKVFDTDNDGEYPHWTNAEMRFKGVPEVTPIYAEPTPDCRTCFWRREASGTGCFMSTDCTNGDQYQSTAPVILWRTK